MADLRHFDLNLLIAFDFLMQEQSVSKAAQRLFVSQSAMSHILQRLRQQLEDPLLVKTPSGMKATERANQLIEPVRSILRDVELLIRAPQAFDPQTSRRRFVIAATDYMDYLVAPLLVERISKQADGVDIQIKRTEISFPERELESGDLDLVLGFDTMLKPAGHLNRELLFQDRMVCMQSQDHLPSGGEVISLENYLARKHMLISRTGTARGVIDDWLSAKGMERRISLIVPHFLSAPLIVAKTDLLLSLPRRIAERFVGLARLKILSLPIDLPEYDLVMIWHPLREQDAGHRWLREQMLAVCETLKDFGQKPA